MKPSGNCRHGLRPDECGTCQKINRLMENRKVVEDVRREIGDKAMEQTMALPIKEQKVRALKKDSASDIVMQAASEFVQRLPFTESDLLLIAWKISPRKFGLAWHESEHPDARKLAVCLYGRKGLIAQGRLCRHETKGMLFVGKETT